MNQQSLPCRVCASGVVWASSRRSWMIAPKQSRVTSSITSIGPESMPGASPRPQGVGAGGGQDVRIAVAGGRGLVIPLPEQLEALHRPGGVRAAKLDLAIGMDEEGAVVGEEHDERARLLFVPV